MQKMPSKKQERQEKAKKKAVRNQQVMGSLRAECDAKKVADKYRLYQAIRQVSSYSWTIKLCKRLLKGERGERKLGSE